MGLGRVVDISGVGAGDGVSLEKAALLRQRLFTIGADMMHVYNWIREPAASDTAIK